MKAIVDRNVGKCHPQNSHKLIQIPSIRGKKGEQFLHRKRYKKAVDSGRRSRGGRTVGDLYGLWNEIWGECPTTTDLEHGLDTAD